MKLLKISNECCNEYKQKEKIIYEEAVNLIEEINTFLLVQIGN